MAATEKASWGPANRNTVKVWKIKSKTSMLLIMTFVYNSIYYLLLLNPLIQTRSNQKEERLIKSDPLVFAPYQLKEGQLVILL